MTMGASKFCHTYICSEVLTAGDKHCRLFGPFVSYEKNDEYDHGIGNLREISVVHVSLLLEPTPELSQSFLVFDDEGTFFVTFPRDDVTQGSITHLQEIGRNDKRLLNSR